MNKDMLNIIMIFAILTSALLFFISVDVILKIFFVLMTIVIMILNYASNKNV